MSEDDIEVVLDKGIMLFRYLQEKDVFEKYYKQHLAKRLLHGRSSSEDAGGQGSGDLLKPKGKGVTSGNCAVVTMLVIRPAACKRCDLARRGQILSAPCPVQSNYC